MTKPELKKCECNDPMEHDEIEGCKTKISITSYEQHNNLCMFCLNGHSD